MISKKLEKGATDSSSIFREAKATKKKKMTVKIPEAIVISIIRSDIFTLVINGMRPPHKVHSFHSCKNKLSEIITLFY